MTLTYNPNLAKVKVDHHAKNEGRRSKGSDRRARTNTQTNRQTNGRYQTHYLPSFAVDNNSVRDSCDPKKQWFLVPVDWGQQCQWGRVRLINLFLQILFPSTKIKTRLKFYVKWSTNTFSRCLPSIHPNSHLFLLLITIYIRNITFTTSLGSHVETNVTS